MTGISSNLNLAAANGTSLTWFTVSFLTHATGLKGSNAAVFISNPHSTSYAFAVIVIVLEVAIRDWFWRVSVAGITSFL